MIVNDGHHDVTLNDTDAEINQTDSEFTEIHESENESFDAFTNETNEISQLNEIAESKKTSDFSQIFVDSFLDCLRTLPRNAQVICSLGDNSRSCEIKCAENITHNFCSCDSTGCSWRNSFNPQCEIIEWNSPKETQKTHKMNSQTKRRDNNLKKILKKGKNTKKNVF
jgi:hypothetical protein